MTFAVHGFDILAVYGPLRLSWQSRLTFAIALCGFMVADRRQRPAAGQASSRLAVAVILVVASALVGACSTIISAIPTAVGGLPAETPDRPATTPEFPVLQAPVPQRDSDTKTLTPEEQKKLESELIALRDGQSGKAKPPVKKPASKSDANKSAAKTTKPDAKEQTSQKDGGPPGATQ